MQLRHFTARLAAEHVQPDQDKLNSFLETITVKKTATQFVPGNPDYWSILVFYENGHEKKTKASNSTTPKTVTTPKENGAAESELTEDEKHILYALKLWRKDKASEINLPEFMVCHNASLLEIVRNKPRKLMELEDIKGFGSQKIARYGDDIIAILNAF